VVPGASLLLLCTRLQTALRAGGFALDYGGSAVAAAGGAWLHVQYCRSKLLLVSRQRGGGQQLRFKLDGPTASGSAWLVGFAIPAADVSSSRPTVVLVALHVQNPSDSRLSLRLRMLKHGCCREQAAIMRRARRRRLSQSHTCRRRSCRRRSCSRRQCRRATSSGCRKWRWRHS